ncbi:MAG: class I SAM-dependent methyltransferase [Bacteroidales bacterium]|nr:class I SAM-dependent methyltransferase [Bacteroidales bacterium]
MSFKAKKIKKIYEGKVAGRYDLPISHMFSKYKKQAFRDSSLKIGDKVLVFCCGTGLDFSEILKKIGKEGKILGIDFSREMLKKAKEKIEKHRWNNIELIEADVTMFKNDNNELFDAGICTLGFSIIPDYKAAYYNLVSKVKDGGEIIIGDMQLASDWYARFNPFTIFLAKRFGGSFEGHQNSLEIYSIMRNDLKEVKKKEFFLKSYYYCIAKK